ncbi:hypothetical protein P168DRAFT_287111 [Aspergillus campestris IBT 28561]|uniref:Ubiquitin-like protein smt3 n=1 Tax=Aspergillus campestris (strain IBT 28561) TaxID=1392248 RepID=A0A2I1DGP0_ASPC2|nr:uncharacterized protein P168DRAFT_287111 [Aspergillus campestris IBT 28561]PKY09039.1 hypothetical protein P168DRAFT_287111 [Aspergillus campestris IBT 28561]
MSTPIPTAELQSSLRQLSIGRSSPAAKDIPRPTVQTTSLVKETAKKNHTKLKNNNNNNHHHQQNHIADSWEDELDSSTPSSDVEADPSSAAPSDILSPSLSVSAEGPLDPPPTPISPQISNSTTAPSASWSATSPPRSGSDSPVSSASRTPTPTSAAPPHTSTGERGGREGGNTTARRPEKQTAVAGRLIAGALGIRAPKRTEEQRAYDRSVKEQEIRRRNREKEAAEKVREEEERAKAAVWDA